MFSFVLTILLPKGKYGLQFQYFVSVTKFHEKTKTYYFVLSISSVIYSMLLLSVVKLSYPKYHFTLFLLLHGCQSTKYKIMYPLLTAPSSNSTGVFGKFWEIEQSFCVGFFFSWDLLTITKLWGNSVESVVIKSFSSYIHTFNMLKMITVKDEHRIEHRQGHKCMIMRPFGVQYHSYLITVKF